MKDEDSGEAMQVRLTPRGLWVSGWIYSKCREETEDLPGPGPAPQSQSRVTGPLEEGSLQAVMQALTPSNTPSPGLGWEGTASVSVEHAVFGQRRQGVRLQQELLCQFCGNLGALSLPPAHMHGCAHTQKCAGESVAPQSEAIFSLFSLASLEWGPSSPASHPPWRHHHPQQ